MTYKSGFIKESLFYNIYFNSIFVFLIVWLNIKLWFISINELEIVLTYFLYICLWLILIDLFYHNIFYLIKALYIKLGYS